MIKLGESVEQLTRLSFTLLFVPAIIIAFGCLSYRTEIIGILYNEHVQQSSKVFGIQIFSFLGMCTTYIFGTLLTANGSMKQLNTMATAAVILNISLNIVLIREFGVIGAALANMATQLFTSVYQVVLASRIFRFKADYVLISRLLVFTLVIALSGFIFREIPVSWYYSFGFFLLFAGVISLLTGLLNINTIFGFARSFRSP
jgi:O-antigen/teichoic acid export membrane protein